MTERVTLTGCGSDDFCLIHGYEYMRSRMGDPIPYCQACEQGCNYPNCDGGPATGYCHIKCRAAIGHGECPSHTTIPKED